MERKRRELGIARLIGFPTASLVLFPVAQAVLVAMLGAGAAVLVYLPVAAALNGWFAVSLQPGESICRLLPIHVALALATTLIGAAVAAAWAGSAGTSSPPRGFAMSESTIRDAEKGARRKKKGARGKGQGASEESFLRLLLFLFLLLGGSTAMADLNAETASAITWPEKLYNPAPAVPRGQPADLILPLPCGGAMAFRPVEIPGGDWLDDRPVELGQSDAERGYKEGRRLSHLAGAFTDESGAARRLPGKIRNHPRPVCRADGTEVPRAPCAGACP